VGLFTILSPYIGTNYTYFNAESYTEGGAGGANLYVEQDNLNIWELGAGLDAAWLLRFDNGSYIQPTASISIYHDLIDDKVEATNRFLAGGNAFRVKGFDSPQTSLLLGAGIEYVHSDKWKMSADYNYEAKSDFDSHSGLRIDFRAFIYGLGPLCKGLIFLLF
jgi:outer membrane autotransporter protein